MGHVASRPVRVRPGAVLLQAVGGVRKSKAGRELDSKTYDGLPSRVELPVLETTKRVAAIAEVERLYYLEQAQPTLSSGQ